MGGNSATRTPVPGLLNARSAKPTSGAAMHAISAAVQIVPVDSSPPNNTDTPISSAANRRSTIVVTISKANMSYPRITRSLSQFQWTQRHSLSASRIEGVEGSPMRLANRHPALLRGDRDQTGEADDLFGILRLTVDQYFVVQVGASAASGAADEADLSLRRDPLADENGVPMQMGVSCGDAVAEIDFNDFA